MNDNLAAMVTEDPEANEAAAIPEETTEETATEAGEETQQPDEQEASFDVTVTALFPWFVGNKENFGDNVTHVKAKIKRVNPEEDLIITVPHPDGTVSMENDVEVPDRKIRIFDKANEISVLDLPGVDMSVFNHNIFRIIYGTPVEGIFIKYYGVSSRHVVFCKEGDDVLIPYAIQKLKKNDEGLDMILPPDDLDEKLAAQVAMEDLILRYKQIEKFQEGLETNLDVIKFFHAKIATVVDVNHLLQIDNAIISLVA